MTIMNNLKIHSPTSFAHITDKGIVAELKNIRQELWQPTRLRRFFENILLEQKRCDESRETLLSGRVFVKNRLNVCVRSLLGGILLAGYEATYAGPPAPNQLPIGGKVLAGSASIAKSGATLNINQTSARAALNWQTFDVGSSATVHFNQPSANSATLNRVQDSNPSQIYGRVTANGKVFFTNPNGMYFGPNASVDVGGLVATTHSISDADFMAGRNTFSRNGATGAIVNDGSLKADLGGYIALLAPEVQNQGIIVAKLGTVALAAGETYELQFDGNNALSNLRVSPATIKTLIKNGRAVQAPGGQIILSAQAVDQLQGSVVNNSGTIEAQGISTKGGVILLDGGDGETNVTGTLDVSSTSGQGGSVTVTGNKIRIDDGAHLIANGKTGGGTVQVGGSWKNEDPGMKQAKSVSVAPTAEISASATGKGNGGTVVVRADISKPGSVARVAGKLRAKGGPDGGDGGRIETSAHLLDLSGIQVDAFAPKGKGGLWLLDPNNVTISTGTTTGGTLPNFTATAASSIVNTTLIQNQINAGTSVNIRADGTITLSNPLTFSLASGNATLTLDNTLGSKQNITLNAAISASGAGQINLGVYSNGGVIANASTISMTGSVTEDNTNRGAITTANMATQATASDAITFTSTATTTGATGVTLNGISASGYGINNAGAGLTATSGSISLTGSTSTGTYGIKTTGTITAGGALTATGIGTGGFYSSNTITATAINITGTGNTATTVTAGYDGVYLIGAKTVQATTGDITITGKGAEYGIYATDNMISTAGNITLSGNATGAGSAVGVYVLTPSGYALNAAQDINVNGYALSTGVAGVMLYNGTATNMAVVSGRDTIFSGTGGRVSSQDGGINLENTVVSAGRNLTMQGASLNGSGVATAAPGTAASSLAYGIYLGPVGSTTISGTTYTGYKAANTVSMWGVGGTYAGIYSQDAITSTSGTVTLTGTSTSSWGINTTGAISAVGALTVTGTGTGGFKSTNTITATSIDITGTGTSGTTVTAGFDGVNLSAAKTVQATTGNITITGKGAEYGIYSSDNLVSTAGNITLSGNGTGSGASSGVYVATLTGYALKAAGNINVNGYATLLGQYGINFNNANGNAPNIMVVDSVGDTTLSGYGGTADAIFLNTSAFKAGGSLTMQGATLTGGVATAAAGTAASSNGYGIYINEYSATINPITYTGIKAGSAISMWGVGLNGSQNGIYNFATISAGGALTLTGTGKGGVYSANNMTATAITK